MTLSTTSSTTLSTTSSTTTTPIKPSTGQVFIKNLGCKVNVYDSQALSYEFSHLGYTITQDPDCADITIINTCSVTKKAEKEARYLLRRYSRSNPKALRVVTGCYAQIDSQTLIEMDEVSYLIPNEAKHSLASFIHQRFQEPATPLQNISQKMPAHTQPVQKNRQGHFKSSVAYFMPQLSQKTRLFLKIQDGCNDFCTYCQIPYARGTSRSVPQQDILREIQKAIHHGCKEVVLTGIHIGEWGNDLPNQPTITDLLTHILNITSHKARIRLSSLEPSEFSQDLSSLIRSHQHNFAHHLHLPLQSGSDKILKHMRRQYSVAQYIETIQQAKEAFWPSPVHLSCDVMVGFPQETDEDFQLTMDLIQRCGMQSWHVFPYSKRPNTAAIKFSGHVDTKTIHQRSRILRELSKQRLHDYCKSFIGKRVDVLWEDKQDNCERRLGKTTHYLKACAPSQLSWQPLPGTISSGIVKGLSAQDTLLVDMG
ncbi:MAG: tRNA (N(6)-L-threonylcarbamoyladenosine(37)-C(2))-methylthiotransferase MtaB [Proteobacteria bacterium]|nr:tRNA (N(6)-L-threonylcarbamoyladenosine(37)-C(2))-methylthiotransferase MtaB [Pseudomonadota bacterium]